MLCRGKRLKVIQENHVISCKVLSCYISGLGVDCVKVLVYSMGVTLIQLSISQTSESTNGCIKGRRECCTWLPDVPAPSISQWCLTADSEVQPEMSAFGFLE